MADDNLIITQRDIEQVCSPAIYSRAQSYYAQGRVRNRALEGHTLVADVVGSRSTPYQVRVEMAPDLIRPSCTCPYWEPYCKHVGALLLAWLHEPESFARRESPPAPAPPAPVVTPAADIDELTAIREELTTLLQGYAVRDLRAIGTNRRFKLRGTLKADIVTQLVDYLSQPPNVRAALADLTSDQRAVLDTLDLLTDTTGVTQPVLQAVVQARHSKDIAARLEDINASLFEHGLVFWHSEDYRPHVARVPRAVRRVLEPLPDLVGTYRGPVNALRVERDEGLGLALAAYNVARLADAGNLTLRPAPQLTTWERSHPYLQGWPHVLGELEALQRGPTYAYLRGNESLTVPPPEPLLSDEALAEVRRRTGLDPDRADFLAHVLLADQMLVADKSRLRVNADRVTAFLQHGGTERLRALCVAWTRVTTWSPLVLALRQDKQLALRRQVGYTNFKPEHLYSELGRSLGTILALLNRLPGGTWFDLDALGETIRQVVPEFLQPSAAIYYGQPAWWLALARTGKPLNLKDPAEWRAGPGAFIRAAFAGPLRWFGLVDLGYDATGLVAFRLTPLGAYLLGRGAPPAAAAAGPVLVVRPDSVIAVRSDAADAEVYRVLDAVAELEAVTVHEFLYRLTAASARRGFETGLDAVDVLGFLERSSSAPVTPAVRQALTHWQAHYGRLHVHGGLTLIEFADDFALRELQLSTSLGQHLVRQFSPRLVAVEPDSLDTLLEEMVRAGHTPKVTGGSR